MQTLSQIRQIDYTVMLTAGATARDQSRDGHIHVASGPIHRA
jgi:hypothetical protein